MSKLCILAAASLLATLVAPAAWGTARFLVGEAGPPSGRAMVNPPAKAGVVSAPAVPAVQLSTGAYVPPAGIDPRLTRALAPAANAPAGRACLLLCRAPAQPAIASDLVGLGVQVLGVYPESTYVVRVQAGHLGALADRAYVQWVGMLPAAYKISPLLEQAIAGLEPECWRAGICAVNIYDAADADLVANRLAAAGMDIETWLPATRTFICRVQTATQARLAAEWSEVSFLEPVSIAHPALTTSVHLCGNADYTRATFDFGITSVVGMIDTGFEIGHQMFNAVSPYGGVFALGWNVTGDGYTSFEDISGHGTHLAGIILGRGTTLAGVCPWLASDMSHAFRVVRCAPHTSPNSLINVETAMSFLASDDAAEAINCGWSNSGNTGVDLTSRTLDGYVWSTHQTYVCSAGNGGPAAGSIAGPGAAKNAVAVGSVSNDSDLTLSYFSAIGPTSDYRPKPDVYAPGESVVSADASGFSLYKEMTGTSVAAAHVTGVLATLFGHYTSYLPRMPATIKAALMATATHREGLVPARAGVVNSYELHSFDNTSDVLYCFYLNNDAWLSDYVTWSWDVPENVAEMWVVLAWIEPAALEGATIARYDDVDLWVDVGGDHSSGYGEYYSVAVNDTVEAVRLDDPVAGHYHFNARKYSASQPYVPGMAIYVRYAGVPVAPTGLTAALSGSDINLTWSHTGDNEHGFHIYHRTSSADPWVQLAEVVTDTTTWRHVAPTPGLTHYYQVKAYNANGESAASNAASRFVPTSWSSVLVSWPVSYGNSWHRQGSITWPGATAIRLHFSDIAVQAYWDHLTSSAGDNWSGNYNDVLSNAASGDTIVLRLDSDASVTGSFNIDRVEFVGGTGPVQRRGPLFGLSSFDDVPTTASIWQYVEAVYREGITSGCANNPPLYCPNSPVTRGQMAVFLCRAAGLAPYNNPTPTFSDVSSSSGIYGYVEAIALAGITSGCAPGLYCPSTPVTRGQMAVFLCRAAGITPVMSPTPTFADVPTGSSIYGYVEAVYAEGITSGCATSPPRYCPGSSITRGQMAVFLCRAFDIVF